MRVPRWLWSVLPDAAETAASQGMARGNAAVLEKRFDVAVLAFEEALAAAREAWGKEGQRTLGVMFEITFGLIAAGRTSEAEPFLVEILPYLDRTYSIPELVELQRVAARACSRMGRVRTALGIWERVEEGAGAIDGNGPLRAEAIFERALANRWLHRFSEASALAARLPESWALQRALLRGRIEYLCRRYDDAVATYEGALRLTSGAATYRTDGRTTERSADAVIVGSRLAVSLFAAGRRDEAVRAHARAELAMEGLEGSHRDRARSVWSFDAAEMEDDPARALRSHQDVLALREKLDGLCDPTTIESRVRVAELYAVLADSDRASRTAGDLTATLDRGFGPAHPWARRMRELAPT